MLFQPAERADEEQARVEKLNGCGATLGEGLDLAGEFAEMIW